MIADERVDIEFGTGALKVTPAHDPMDFEIGRDHGLPEPSVIGLDGRMNEEAGELAGLTQGEAEKRILDWIKEHGLLVKREAYRHTVALCERCGSRIEPLDLAPVVVLDGRAQQPALEALRSRRVQSTRSRRPVTRSTRSRTRPTGTSRARSGGVTGSRSGSAPDGHETVAETDAGGVRRVRVDRADEERGRPGHLVLVRALAVRDPRLARGDARASGLVPGHVEHDGARDQPPLGVPDDLLGARADGRDPVPPRRSSTRWCSPRTGGGCRRASAPGSTRSS